MQEERTTNDETGGVKEVVSREHDLKSHKK